MLSFRCHLEQIESKQSFNYSAANWDLFLSYVVSHLNTKCLDENCSISEINVAIKHLSVTLISAARHANRLKSSTFRSLQIATSIRVLVQKRNRLRSLWQRTHDFSLRPLLNSLKSQINSAIKQQVPNTWQKILQALDTSNIRDTWRISKRLTRDYQNIPPLTFNGNTAITTQEKLKAFADSFEHIFTTNPDINRRSQSSLNR
jgi:hypothetical protein